MGDDRNAARSRHMTTKQCLGNKIANFFLPHKFRCRPWVVYSCLIIAVVSITQLWYMLCPRRAWSSCTLTLLISLFIHDLLCLLKRFTNPTFVLPVLCEVKVLSNWIMVTKDIQAIAWPTHYNNMILLGKVFTKHTYVLNYMCSRSTRYL